ncbi:hypothetical protein HNO89_001499 [Sporosarcina luteola]|nr:hypothetical protein [Sporosarcina luteola]
MVKINKFVKLAVPLALGLAFCGLNTTNADAAVLPVKNEYGSGSGKTTPKIKPTGLNRALAPTQVEVNSRVSSVLNGGGIGNYRQAGAYQNTYKNR